MSIQSTLPAFPRYPARIDYKERLEQLPPTKCKVDMARLPNIEGWIYTPSGFPVPALCAPFPQFDTAPDLYRAQQFLSDAQHCVRTDKHYYICTALTAVGKGNWITTVLRNYIEDCLLCGNGEVATCSSFIATTQSFFASDEILQVDEMQIIYKDGRIFWIDWMLHQVAQQLTNYAGEQA